MNPVQVAALRSKANRSMDIAQVKRIANVLADELARRAIEPKPVPVYPKRVVTQK